MSSCLITSWQIEETNESSDRFHFLELQNHYSDCSHEIKRHLLLGRKTMRNLERILKSTDITLPTKACIVKAMIFLVVIELGHRESWAQRNCFWIVVLEKTLENPLDTKDIKPFNPKENQLWISIARTDAEALRLWPPYVKSRLIEKDPDVGKDWRREEKGMTEDEMVR